MKTLFVLEDDKTTQALIKATLQPEYKLHVLGSLKDANSSIESINDVSLFLLDRVLPDGDSISFCQRLRCNNKFQHLPIIFLSGLNSEAERVFGLTNGGDDYVIKPFYPMELRARIAARLRNASKKLLAGNLEIRLDELTVINQDQASSTSDVLDLTPIEFKLLVSLCENKNRFLSRQQLLDKVWGIDHCASDRIVDTHISNLRRKIGKSGISIESIRGAGYRLQF